MRRRAGGDIGGMGPSRGAAALLVAAGLLWAGPVLPAASPPAQGAEVTWTVGSPLAAEGDPEHQEVAALAATPWLAAKELGGIVYFVFLTPARIERYDMAGRAWLAPIPLDEAPTAFHVDGDGLYVGFGRRVSRFSLDGEVETHLANTNHDIAELVTIGSFLYAHDLGLFYSVDKWSGGVVDTAEFFYSLRGLSAAPDELTLLGRSAFTSPADVVAIYVTDDGMFDGQADSPYHGDYPSAQKTWLYPGGALVVDNSGIVYHTDLTFAGSLGGQFQDVAFHGLTAVVLRSGVLIAYSQGFRRVGEQTPATAPSAIFTEGESILAFSWDGSQIEVEEIPLDSLSVPEPGTPVDPRGLAYTPDQMVFDGEDVLYLLHRGSLSVFRWSLSARDYLETIPLVKGPSFMALSTVNDVLYFTYSGGEITELPLAVLEESPLVNSPQTPCGLATAGEYIFVCDPTGAWVSHFTYGPDGTLISQEEWNYFSEEYVWSEPNRRMYFFRDDTGPNDLHWEEVLPDGSLGLAGESPYHGGVGTLHPIHVAPDGSIVLLGSGRIYDAISIAQLDTLSNDITDAVWGEGTLLTLRPWGEQSQIQTWGVNYGVDDTRELPGEPLGLFSDGAALLVVTSVEGEPELTILDFELEAPGFVIRKTDGLDFARPGQEIAYRIEVVNVSSATIAGAVVEDVTPPEVTGVTWTCAASPGSTCAGGLHAGDVSDVVEVEPGDMLVYTVWAEIDPGAPDGVVTNVVTVRESTGATARATDPTIIRHGLIFTDYFESGDLSRWIDHGD